MKRGDLVHRLPTSLFWDVDPASLDEEAHSVFIISRVMDRGDRPDVDEVFSYYGQDKVKEALLAAPCLDRRTIAYFANYFDVAESDFKASRRVA